MSAFSLNFPFAYGGPLGAADFRTEPEDFIVDEQLGFQPCGDGEHLYLQLRKRNQNTRWVAGQLAGIANIRPMDVGFGGMKDRRGITSQWFSLYLPRRELDLKRVAAIEGVDLLASGRHNRKLRRGDHAANDFVIRLRHCTASQHQLEQRLQQIAATGAPNYFGEQRFGHGGNNLVEFQRLFTGCDGDARSRVRQGSRREAGIYLSAGRSYLYNRILSARVEQGSWRCCLPGEDMPSGALWGRGRSQACRQVAEFEQRIVEALPDWCDALEHSGLAQERRNLVLLPQQLQWQFEVDGQLVISFRLAPGLFATSLLRELVELVQPRH